MKTKKAFSLAKDDAKSLSKRYLFWLYKTTKDELDKIERKFTQLAIDRRIAKVLGRDTKALGSSLAQALAPFLKEWKEYVFQKESDAANLKFTPDGAFQGRYVFLHLKLKAVLEAARDILGKKALGEFKKLYEEAAIEGILQDTSGRR